VSRIDLHLHTTASDGRYRPEELVRKASEIGLTVIAIADHDSVDGITPALEEAKNFPHLTVIPCVEVSTDVPSGEVHILGYFIDYKSEELKTALAHFRDSREGRAQGMIDKLAGLGIHIEWSRVKEIAGDGSVGRPHIAQAMLEKGYIGAIKDAFDKYIARNGPAYVEREKMTPSEAVKLIVRNDGLPVMAHPFTVTDVEAMIIGLKAAGLVGIEAYYKEYTGDESSRLLGLAKKHDLITTGGTDYHGLDDANEIMMGGADVPMESVEQLYARAERRALEPSGER
jgi:predicted metal-dependent phosphoesterase TrpH